MLGNKGSTPFGPCRGDDADCIKLILDRHRDAMKRSCDLFACESGIGLTSLSQGFIRSQLHDRVQLRIDRFNAFEIGLYHLFRRDLFVANGMRERAGGGINEFLHVFCSFL